MIKGFVCKGDNEKVYMMLAERVIKFCADVAALVTCNMIEMLRGSHTIYFYHCNMIGLPQAKNIKTKQLKQ